MKPLYLLKQILDFYVLKLNQHYFAWHSKPYKRKSLEFFQNYDDNFDLDL